jgi:hypothetical protein
MANGASAARLASKTDKNSGESFVIEFSSFSFQKHLIKTRQ